MMPKHVSTQTEGRVRFHILLRVSFKIKIAKLTLGTISAHNDVIAKKGRVAVAKFGAAIGEKTIRTIQTQIQNGSETCLVLALRRENNYIGYSSRIVSVHLGKATRDVLNISPDYYAKLGETGTVWFIVNHPFERCDLSRLYLHSNKRQVVDVLNESRTSTILVEEST